MSCGVVCLNCRRYVWHDGLPESERRHTCQCALLGMTPRPSLDARTEATPEQVARYRAAEVRHG